MITVVRKYSAIIVACMMAMFVFAGCGRSTTHVYVYIIDDYGEKFYNQEFVLEDFEWENAKEFFYHYDYVNRSISVFLQRTGRTHANEAIRHMATLPFVERATMGATGTRGQRQNTIATKTVFSGSYMVTDVGVEEGFVDLRALSGSQRSMRITYSLDESVSSITIARSSNLQDRHFYRNLSLNSLLLVYWCSETLGFMFTFTDGSPNHVQILRIVTIEVFVCGWSYCGCQYI